MKAGSPFQDIKLSVNPFKNYESAFSNKVFKWTEQNNIYAFHNIICPDLHFFLSFVFNIADLKTAGVVIPDTYPLLKS